MKTSYEDNVFEELLNFSSYLFDINEELAQRFLDSCDLTFQFIAKNPFIGSPNKFNDTELTSIRMTRVKNFNKYLVFYVRVDDGIRILHVIHAAMDFTRIFGERDD